MSLSTFYSVKQSCSANDANLSVLCLLRTRLFSVLHIKHRIIDRIIHIELYGNSENRQKRHTLKQ